ncbi:SPFH domain-containing protein [Hasllibacter sp. MH4015]|uniref:SPFH domain-containing protein n=1 Tax=Hasllibacter sp. MH4015 TaxID=2854029 RepID=UPI001CD59EB0|nr:SPFH domain-containing protein [Hasllibacter sp. MH4015]
MTRWVFIAIALGAALVLWAVWLWQGAVTVQPHQRAVVARGDGIEVLEPGLHLVTGFGRTVTIYDVQVDRAHRVTPPLMIGGCPVTLEMVFTVDDVATFHRAGGDFDAIATVNAAVLERAEAIGFTLQDPLRPGLSVLHEEVQAIMPTGLSLVRLNGDVGGCAQAGEAAVPTPAPQVARAPMDLVQGDAALGGFSAALDPLQLLTADGARLELSGALATFDLVDAALAEACFGTDATDRAADIAGNIVRAGLREAAGGADRVDVPRALAEATFSQGARMEADCGLRIGPVDFSAARLDWLRAAE